MKQSKTRRAFTLPEVMIALAVLLLAIVMIFGTLRRSAELTRRFTTATALAQQKLEDLMGVSYGRMAAGSDIVGEFSRVWSIQNDTLPALINVSVTWQNLDGTERELTLTSARTP
jgi:prepilin-type N-terminal cleavage/methylation domain-containing protein